jgi:hypothetical protein
MYFVPYYEDDGLKIDNEDIDSPKNDAHKLVEAQSSVEKIVDLENVSNDDSDTEKDADEN